MIYAYENRRDRVFLKVIHNQIPYARVSMGKQTFLAGFFPYLKRLDEQTGITSQKKTI